MKAMWRSRFFFVERLLETPLLKGLLTGLITLLFAPVAGAVTIEQNGIEVEFSLAPLGRPEARPRANSEAAFTFAIKDLSGAPVAGGYPAAWLQRRAESVPTDSATCKNMVKTFIGGSLLSQPTLNLNVYYVVVLNDDATVSVVDPLFSFGGTNLLTMIALSSSGYDWSLSEKHAGLFITLPETRRVAMIETDGFKLAREIELDARPQRIALQPDQHYLWVGADATLATRDSPGADAGEVIVIETASGEVVKHIGVGRGRHAFAFSPDNRYAFVTNELDNSVSVIDIARLQKVRDIETGAAPVAIAWSAAAGAVYISHAGDGAVVGVDVKTLRTHPKVILAPGLGQIRFAPNGRHALVVNPDNDRVYVWDALNNRVTKSGKIDGGPDKVTFSSTLGYVRHRDSETVYMLPMDVIVDADLPLQVVDFPGGQRAFGRADTPADNIVQAPGENAVLVAHPGDRQVYYYKEGMAAPMGSFKNYQRSARAVIAVDRSLRETRPGRYETVARLGEAGTYDVAFFMETPRVVHCFSVRVAPVKQVPGKPAPEKGAPRLQAVLLPDQQWRAGQAGTITFRLQNAESGQPLAGLNSLDTLTVLAPGVWQSRGKAREQGEGVYSFDWVPPRAGAYFIRLDSDWKARDLDPPQQLMLKVM